MHHELFQEVPSTLFILSLSLFCDFKIGAEYQDFRGSDGPNTSSILKKDVEKIRGIKIISKVEKRIENIKNTIGQKDRRDIK